MNVFHLFPYSARLPGGHSNAIRGFIACQRAAGINACGLSPATDEVFANAVEPGSDIIETKFDDPARLVRLIRDQGGETDVVTHLHAIDPFCTEFARLAKAAGMRVVMTSHGQLNSRSMLHAAKKFVYFSTRRSPASYADAIHFLTEKEAKRFRFLIPFYSGQTTTIHHAIDFPETVSHPPPTPFTITHLGRIDIATKGLDLLLTGFKKANLSNARLILAGPDWNDGVAKLTKLAEQLGCVDRVSFPGAVYGRDKERLILESSLFAATSRWEAFGISLVEAMAAGTPTLISEKMNLAPSLARAGASCVVKCTAHAIAMGLKELEAHPQRRTDLSRLGRRWALENCSPGKVGATFREFYQNVLSA